MSRHAYPTQRWRFTAHSQTQKLAIRSKRRVTGCLIVRRRTCSPRWHTRRVPRTVLSERLVLIRSPDEKEHVVFNNTCAHDCGQPCLHCTSTAYCGYHKKKSQCRRHAFKQPRRGKCRVQYSSCCDLNASRNPELMKEHLPSQQKLPVETQIRPNHNNNNCAPHLQRTPALTIEIMKITTSKNISKSVEHVTVIIATTDIETQHKTRRESKRHS